MQIELPVVHDWSPTRPVSDHRRPAAPRVPALLTLILAVVFSLPASAGRSTGGDADLDPDVSKPDPALTCEEMVVLDEGRFELEGDPYELKGVNFAMGIGATATELNGQWTFEYFAQPNGNYRPQNFAVPWTSWHDPSQGCSDEASCRQMMLDEHIPQLLALGANGVRLVGLGISFDADALPYRACQTVYSAGQSPPACRMDLSTAAQRQRLIEIVEGVVETLGSYGIRTIYLASGGNPERPAAHPINLLWLDELSQAFASNPYLIGYDPYNEPVYAYEPDNDHADFDDPSLCLYDGGSPFCKGAAQAVAKTWFDALTANDPYHFVSVGLGGATNSADGYWDPLVLYDHFASFHIYPQRGGWDDGSGYHASDALASEIYFASFAGCGDPCPYLGDYDEAHCLAGASAVGQQGFIWNDGFFYPPRSGSNPCPEGWYDGPDCKVNQFDQGRDQPFTLLQPIFYVEPQNGSCPSGTTFDGANCMVAFAPPGVHGFLYTPSGGPTNFYYTYIDPNGEHCRAPAWDDNANCMVGPVPAGYDPFILERTLFYVEATTCGPKKPIHLGESGFSSYPNGVDLIPANNQITMQLADDLALCASGLPQGAPPADGPVAEQIDFLLGDITPGWEGIGPYSDACGFQGLHWWQLADVKWGACRENNFGLFTYWWKRQPTDGGDPAAMVAKDTVVRFRDDLHFGQPGASSCRIPDRHYATSDRRAQNPNYTHVGRVLDPGGQPVPQAVVHSWESVAGQWRGRFLGFTDEDGVYRIQTENCLVQIASSRFGYTRDDAWTGLPGDLCAAIGSTLTLPDLVIEPLPTSFDPSRPDLPILPDPAYLAAPSVRKTACKVSGEWVVLP